MPHFSFFVFSLWIFGVGPGYQTVHAAGPKTPVSGDQIDVVLSRAKQERLAGNFDESIRLYDDVLKEASKPGEELRHNRALLGIGMSQMSLSHFSEAFRCFQVALSEASDHHMPQQVGWAALDLSTLNLAIRDPAAAALYAEKAKAYFLIANEPDGVTRAGINLATADFSLERFQLGLAELREITNIAAGSQNSRTEALAAENLGVLLLRTGSLHEAEQCLKRSALIFQRLGDKASTLALNFDLAKLCLKQHNARESEAYLKTLLPNYNPETTGIPLYAVTSLEGELAFEQGDIERALRQLRVAAQLAYKWRRSAPFSDRVRTLVLDSLNEEVLSDYISLVSQLALDTGREVLIKEAFEAQACNRALSLREQISLSVNLRQKRMSDEYLQLLHQLAANAALYAANRGSQAQAAQSLEEIRVRLSELEGQALEHEAPQILPESFNAASVQRTLRPTEVLLSFYCTKRVSYLFVTSSRSISIHQISGSDELSEVGREAIEITRKDAVDTQNSLHRLFKMMFGGVPGPEIDPYRDWIIVGDDRLSQWPIAALSGLDDLPIISKHTVRVSPTEIPLRIVGQQPLVHNLIGIGDPIYNLADSRNDPLAAARRPASNAGDLTFARLPGSGDELAKIAAIKGFDGTTLLTGSRASVASLRDQLDHASYEVLHVAAHFVSLGRDGAALALSLRAGSADLLTAELASTLKLDGGLVVLNGCDSGFDPQTSLESVAGQARGWLEGGARSVVVTTWPINDSGFFFEEFYRSFSANRTTPLPSKSALALQAAQVRMITLKRPISEWAAYRLISLN